MEQFLELNLQRTQFLGGVNVFPPNVLLLVGCIKMAKIAKTVSWYKSCAKKTN